MKQWQTIQIPLSEGMDTKSDRRMLNPPNFELLRDASWEEVGGIQTRKPYASQGTTIFGGGSLANIRRIVENGDELLCFTKDSLYSFNAALGQWVLKGTHLAVKIEEETKFSNAGDQVDADRAELNGTVIYTWVESDGGLYVAASDKTTGAVLLAPTGVNIGGNRPRLVALSTKVLLVFMFGTDLVAYAIDPANPVDAISSAISVNVITSGISAGAKFDVVRVGSSDTAIIAAVRTVTTSYSLATVTAGLVVTATTKARTCTGAIAVSVEPSGSSVQVIRANGLGVEGDYITISGFADVRTGQSLGTTITNSASTITACHRSVQDSGAYRCYVFWSSNETSAGGADWSTKKTWVDTAGTIDSQSFFKRRWAPRARAFDRDGSIYVWGAFYGQSAFDPFGTRVALQSTYFLLRDDGFLVAKAVTNTAGAGAGGSSNDGNGWIPNCQDIGSDSYAFAALTCRVIEVGSGSSFAARSPRDVVFTFDSSEARRTARIGQTMYVACGEGLLQYDGQGLTEVGFHQAPWYVLGAESAAGGIAANGSYAAKLTWRSINGRGEVERSTSFAVGSVAIAAAPGGIDLSLAEPLYLTHKTSVAWEAWRTLLNPTADAPFYLATGKDPATVTGSNCFVFNNTALGVLATWNDAFSDTTISTKEVNPENGGLLEATPPPPASIITASADRLFLAGISGEPYTVHYSKLRADGEVASFNDALTLNVPTTSGAITGIAFLNETLIVFTESALYAASGDGYDNLGGGQNYGPARTISNDVGAVSHESIVLTPAGLVFLTRKGWYLLDRGWNTSYIGAPVSDFDSEVIIAAQALEKQHQIRFLTSARMLVFDYNPNPTQQWCEWTTANGVSSCMYNGVHYYATTTDVKYQRTDYTGINYGLDAELAWIKLNDLQGAGSVRWLALLGAYRGACKVRIRLARDYQQDGAGDWLYYQDNTWTPSPTVIGGPLQVRVGPSIPKCMAIKVRITVQPAVVALEDVWSEAIKLTGLALDVGIDQGFNRRLPVAQKT